MDAWTAVLDRLLAGLAHDVNGRASAVRGAALLARDEPPGTLIPLLEAEAERLERLAAGVSALRIEPPEPLDVMDVLHAAAQTLATLHVDVEPRAPDPAVSLAVFGTRGLLVRTVVGLSLQLVPARAAGRVRLTPARVGGEVQLEISGGGAATSLPMVTVPIPEAAVEVLPAGYRLRLRALDG